MPSNTVPCNTGHVYERYVDSQAAVDQLNMFAGKFSERFYQLVDRTEFVVLGSPSAELKVLLDGFGATKYPLHLSSYACIGSACNRDSQK